MSRYMQRALALAREAEAAGEVPIGAVVVLDGEIIGEGRNAVIERSDPTAHAEVLALRAAGARQGNYRLPGAEVYATLEPCCMCAGALIHSRVARVHYAAADPKTGAAGGRFDILNSTEHNHQVVLQQGECEAEAAALLQAFFRRRRAEQRA